MNDAHGSSPLDALRINRGKSDDNYSGGGFPYGMVFGGAAVVALVLGIGFVAYTFWPSSAVPVHAMTVEADVGGPGTSLDASGYVVARLKATISPKIPGRLLSADLEAGDHVKAGQIIATLDPTSQNAALHEAQARAAQARAAFENAKPTYERYKALQAQNAISIDQLHNQKTIYDSARTALVTAEASVATLKSVLNDTVVRAPFTGVITEKVAQVGEFVATAAGGGGTTRTGIATIVDMDSLEVEVDVSENYIERIRPGQKATVSLNAYPQWQIKGSVIAIIPTANMAKASVTVRIRMEEKDPRILPQMGARVAFQGDDKAPAVAVSRGMTVPADAVKIDGKNGIVFVIKADDILEQRTVSVGPSVGETVTILSGLANGDRIVTGDLTKLQDGTKVAVTAE